MIRVIAVLIAVLTLSACEVFQTSRTDAQIRFGQPRIVLSPSGVLVVNQEPLLLQGRRSITWTLPKDGAKYEDFTVVINSAVKRAVREGNAIRYVPIDAKRIEQPLKCTPVDAFQFRCDFTPALERVVEKSVLYTYTLTFKRNNVRFELDPTVMPEE